MALRTSPRGHLARSKALTILHITSVPCVSLTWTLGGYHVNGMGWEQLKLQKDTLPCKANRAMRKQLSITDLSRRQGGMHLSRALKDSLKNRSKPAL
jgi:hypothetical protein